LKLAIAKKVYKMLWIKFYLSKELLLSVQALLEQELEQGQQLVFELWK
jgi:hypothetical protein